MQALTISTYLFSDITQYPRPPILHSIYAANFPIDPDKIVTI